MFDKLEDLLIRYEEVMGELQEPGVANDPERFRKLMKEQSDLAPIVEAYNEYKQCKQNIEDSLMMLEEESDEEKMFEDCWIEFYNSVGIKERHNLKLMQNNMPKKYWKYLPEKNKIYDNEE